MLSQNLIATYIFGTFKLFLQLSRHQHLTLLKQHLKSSGISKTVFWAPQKASIYRTDLCPYEKKEIVWDLHIYLQMPTSTLDVLAPVVISENLISTIREFRSPIK